MTKKGSYRKWVVAAKMVNEQKMSIYKAAKINGVPLSSLKDFLIRDNFELVPKMGRPYALTSDLEIQILNYIIKMQELGFGLTVLQIRKIAHKSHCSWTICPLNKNAISPEIRAGVYVQ